MTTPNMGFAASGADEQSFNFSNTYLIQPGATVIVFNSYINCNICIFKGLT